MAKDSTRVTPPRIDEEPLGGGEDGGATTDGKGGYMTGQGGGSGADAASTEGTGSGSSA